MLSAAFIASTNVNDELSLDDLSSVPFVDDVEGSDGEEDILLIDESCVVVSILVVL